MATVINRLTTIDGRLSDRVSRKRIGSLIGRVYFTPNGSTAQEEVLIFKFVDQGVTSVPWATGTEQIGHRYLAHVSRDWWDVNGETEGKYEIRVNETGPLISVMVDNQVAEDDKTYVAISLKVITEVEPTLDVSTFTLT